MESLLRQSGLVNEEDWGRTDLGTLERRIAEQNHRRSSPGTPSKSPSGSASTGAFARPSSSSQNHTPRQGQSATPLGSASPDPTKEKEPEKGETQEKDKSKEEEVEALSDMMCSLVTNNCGETRYIGMYLRAMEHNILTCLKVLRPVSPSSHPRAYSGSTKRPATARSKR